MTTSIPPLPTLVDAAGSWRGPVPAPDAFELVAGETVYYVGEDVELVELRDTEPPLVGGSSAFDYAQACAMAEPGFRFARGIWLQESVPARDSGCLVITDRRVVLLGAKSREWPLDKVVDITHDDGTPETWLTTSHRKRVSGFRYLGAAAVQVRFCLALAMAEARAQRPMLVAFLTAQAAAVPPVAPVASTAVLPVPVPPGVPAAASVAAAGTSGPALRALAGRAVLGPRTHSKGRRVLRGAATAFAGLVLLSVALPDAPAEAPSTLNAAASQDTRDKDAASEARASEERQAEERAADDQAEADRAAAERAAAEQAAAERVAAEDKAAADAAAAKVAADQAAADQAAADKIVADRAAAEQAAAAQAEADRAAEVRRQQEAPQALAAAPSSGGCEESYPDFCIPASGGDVNCADLSQKDFTAREPDPYGLDRDSDGVACES